MLVWCFFRMLPHRCCAVGTPCWTFYLDTPAGSPCWVSLLDLLVSRSLSVSRSLPLSLSLALPLFFLVSLFFSFSALRPLSFPTLRRRAAALRFIFLIVFCVGSFYSLRSRAALLFIFRSSASALTGMNYYCFFFILGG